MKQTGNERTYFALTVLALILFFAVLGIDYIKKNPTLPAVLLSAALAFWSWVTQRRLTRAKNSIDLQNNYMAAQHEHLVAVADMSSRLVTEEAEALARLENPGEEERAQLGSIRDALNCLERMAIGIKRDVYEESLLYDSYATYVIKTWIAFRPFVKIKQINAPYYYRNLEWMYTRWRSMRDIEDEANEKAGKAYSSNPAS